MPNTKRPRVAAIGLNDSLIDSISSLCGTLRTADSAANYRQRYNWTETDVVVAGAIKEIPVNVSVNLLTIGSMTFEWSDKYRVTGTNATPRHRANTRTKNTERELAVPAECPGLYRPLAADVTAELRRAPGPPLVMTTTRDGAAALIETTSGHAVALRFVLPMWQDLDGNEHSPIALLLPEGANLAAWFRAFLSDIHDCDPDRVPVAPPRLSQPSDWHTLKKATWPAKSRRSEGGSSD